MIPVDRLSLVSSSAAKPGTLVLLRIGGPPRPMLAVALPVGDDTVSGFLDFTPKSGQPMRVQLASSISGPLLAIDKWELLVDPESSYSARSSDPHPGDAIISSGQFGFVAVRDYSEIYIGLTGLALPEPDWVGGFGGFQKWRMVCRIEAESPPLVLVEYGREG